MLFKMLKCHFILSVYTLVLINLSPKLVAMATRTTTTGTATCWPKGREREIGAAFGAVARHFKARGILCEEDKIYR